jgi:hypothetical protein
MNTRTQLRTLSTMLMLVLVVMLNTAFQLLNIYDARVGLPLYAATAAIMILALRHQQRLSRLVTGLLLLLPIVLVVLAGLLSLR